MREPLTVVLIAGAYMIFAGVFPSIQTLSIQLYQGSGDTGIHFLYLQTMKWSTLVKEILRWYGRRFQGGMLPLNVSTKIQAALSRIAEVPY